MIFTVTKADYGVLLSLSPSEDGLAVIAPESGMQLDATNPQEPNSKIGARIIFSYWATEGDILWFTTNAPSFTEWEGFPPDWEWSE